MRLLLFYLILLCLHTISFAQSLEDKMADKLCECFTTIDRSLKAERIMAQYQEHCFTEIMRSFESEIKIMADTIHASTDYERGHQAGQLLNTRTQIIMIDRCDHFFQTLDKLRNEIFETANEAEELLNIEAKTKQIEKTPSASAYYNRALSFFVLRKFKLAKSDLDKAIELDKDYPASYLLRGFLFEQTKKFPEALADYELSQNFMGKDEIDLFIAMVKRKQRKLR